MKRKPGAAWVAAEQAVDQVEFDLSEALATLKENLTAELLVEVALEEQERCIDWIKTSLSKKKIIEGVESGEYAPGTRKAADQG